MREHDTLDQDIKKLLLLGSGSSGKSTLFQQLKCIYSTGFEPDEIDACKYQIRSNVVQCMIKLLQCTKQFHEEDPDKHALLREDKETYAAVELVVEMSSFDFTMGIEIESHKMRRLGEAIGFLWDLPEIQLTFKRRSEFAFVDNMEYFFNKAELLYLDDYQPIRMDALQTRWKTTGLTDRRYEIKERYFHIYDVGGQRNERKKWIHAFENVTAVLFVAALNHYNAVLYEDEGRNAMHESIALFDEICNSKWFRRTEMILFLNKNDLFCDALREGHSLRKCFHREVGWNGQQWDESNGNYDVVDYEKKDDIQKDNECFEFCYRQSLDFVRDRYLERNHNPLKMVFCHVTTATSTTITEKVFWEVQNIIIRSNLKRKTL